MQQAQIISDSVSAVDGRYKPDTNISLNIDEIDDPVEYFKAFEKQEEAKKEIQKLRGGFVIDVTQQDQGRKTRKRRPGLSERRAVYKHYISEEDAMVEKLAKIQEKHHEALNYSGSLINSELVDGTMSQTDNKNNKPQEPELEDSVAGREKNELDHLLASLKDLDEGDRVIEPSRNSHPQPDKNTSPKSIGAGDLQVARGSSKIMQQAQIASNSVSAIDGLYKEGETIDASFKTRGQERRPALGRKQARFSIKPDGPSYSKPDTNISLNIDDIDDPVEYFKAFEKQQKVEKEMQKLRGGIVIDVTQQDQGTKTRKRRPGLSARRAVYKHYISEEDAMAETMAKIQEKHHEALNYSSSLINSELVDGTVSQTNNKNNKPQEPELEDSVAGRENNELDHILASLKDLDEGEGESYLREMLHLKPIDVCKINLPALPNRTMHVVSEDSELPKILLPSIRSPLVSVSTFLKEQLSNLRNVILSFPEDAADSPDSSSSKSAGSSPVVEPDRVIEPSWNSHPLPDKNTSPKPIGAGDLQVDANLQMPDARISQEAMDSSDQASENQHFLPNTDNEHQVTSQTPSNELGTQKAPLHPRKRKMDNKRHSLAVAGTFGEDGRRRSSRRKFRPLEHWRGERLLLGRTHDSLPTVIGVKYASPGNNRLKVESYVSAEFDDLLNIAAKG